MRWREGANEQAMQDSVAPNGAVTRDDDGARHAFAVEVSATKKALVNNAANKRRKVQHISSKGLGGVLYCVPKRVVFARM